MKLTINARVLKVGFTFLLLLFLSCNNEDLEKSTTDFITQQLQNDLKLEHFTNKNLVVNWESLQKTEKDSSEIYEIEVTEKIKSEMISKFLQKDVKYELIAVKSSDKVHSYLVEAFSNLNYQTFLGTIQNLNKFAGTLNVYELNGAKIGQLLIFEGKAQNPSKNSSLDVLETVINGFYKLNNLTKKVPECNSIITVFSEEEVWTVRYSVTTLGSTGQVLNIKYLGETLTSTKRTYLFSYPLPCNSSGNQEPESAILHRVRTEAYEKRIVDSETLVSLIDDSKLTPCYKDVMDQLKKGTNSKLLRVYEKLNVDFSKYNTTFVNGAPTKPGDVADSKRSTRFNYNITIDMDNRYTTSTKLFKANAMLHELLHVYFMSLEDDYLTGNPPNPAVFDDFPTLFQAMVSKNYPGSKGDDHHDQMATTYVNAIAEILQEYQTGVFVAEGKAKQEYKDLAWHGLEKTTIYAKLTDAEKIRIENRFGAESRGGDVGGQILIGKLCN